jgi:hypothetical protein
LDWINEIGINKALNLNFIYKIMDTNTIPMTKKISDRKIKKSFLNNLSSRKRSKRKSSKMSSTNLISEGSHILSSPDLSIPVDKLNVDGNEPSEDKKQLLEFVFGNSTSDIKESGKESKDIVETKRTKDTNKIMFGICMMCIILLIILSIPSIDMYISQFIPELSYRIILRCIILIILILCMIRAVKLGQ